MTWTPEFVAIIIAIFIPFQTATAKETGIPLKYLILLILYLGHIFFGILLNDISGWTILAGLRIYTKFLPIFMLPLIYPLTDKAFKTILLWVYAMSMAQFPVVLWQRFVRFAETLSGDPMGGTLGHSTSGVLAIYLVTIISFLIAFYYKDQISLPLFLVSAGAAFVPLTLNETKISFVLLPIAFIFPAFFIQAKRESIFRLMLVILLLILSFLAFKAVYDYFATKRWGYGITGFVSQPGKLEDYSSNRLDPILNSIRVGALKDARFAVFGHGVGNVSEGFTKRLSGKYYREGQFYDINVTFAMMMWELGFLGTFLFLLFPFFIFWDARKLCKKEGWIGAYALGMVSYALFFFLSLFYTFTIHNNVLIFIFFLAAGQLVSLSKQAEGEGRVKGIQLPSPV